MIKNITTINEIARLHFGITRDEYALCQYIQYRLADPRGKMSGWCFDIKSDISKFIGITRPGLYKMLTRLEKLRLIDIDAPTGYLRVTGMWLDFDSGKEETMQIGRKQSLQPGVNKVDTGCKQSLHGGVNKVTLIKEELDYKNDKHEQLRGAAAAGSIHSTLYDPSTPGVVLHESFHLEERNSKNDLVPRRAENSAPAPRPWASFDIDEQAENLKYDFQCIERFARDLKCSLEVATEKMPPAVDEFVFDQKANTYNYNNTRDFRTHFFNWLPLRTKSKRAANTTATNANGYNSNNTQSVLPKALQNQVGK